jgi:kynurenine formamidase
VIDVSEKAKANPDYLIEVTDVTAWENQHGKIPQQSIVLFNTGYWRHYPQRKAYFGTDKTGLEAIAHLHFPGISPDLSTWLVEQRKPKAVGIDTASIDYGQSTDFQTHRILLGQNILGFENLTNLDQLPPTGALVVALPMNISGGSGGPLRIVAGLAKE